MKTFVTYCIQLASHMVSMAKEIDYDEAKKEVLESLEDGRAYQNFWNL